MRLLQGTSTRPGIGEPKIIFNKLLYLDQIDMVLDGIDL